MQTKKGGRQVDKTPVTIQELLQQFEVEDELIYLIEDAFCSYNEALYNLVKR